MAVDVGAVFRQAKQALRPTGGDPVDADVEFKWPKIDVSWLKALNDRHEPLEQRLNRAGTNDRKIAVLEKRLRRAETEPGYAEAMAFSEQANKIIDVQAGEVRPDFRQHTRGALISMLEPDVEDAAAFKSKLRERLTKLHAAPETEVIVDPEIRGETEALLERVTENRKPRNILTFR